MSLPLSLDPQIRAELEPLGAELLGIFEKRNRRVFLLELPGQAGFVVVTEHMAPAFPVPMSVDTGPRSTLVQFPATPDGRELARKVTERYLAGSSSSST